MDSLCAGAIVRSRVAPDGVYAANAGSRGSWACREPRHEPRRRLRGGMAAAAAQSPAAKRATLPCIALSTSHASNLSASTPCTHCYGGHRFRSVRCRPAAAADPLKQSQGCNEPMQHASRPAPDVQWRAWQEHCAAAAVDRLHPSEGRVNAQAGCTHNVASVMTGSSAMLM